MSHQGQTIPVPEKWTQEYAPKDLKEPTAADTLLDKAFERFTVHHVKREAPRDLERKERVLVELNKIFNTWVRQCAVDAGVGTEVNGQPVEGRLETSGSWKLAIHEKDADIDLVCVAPQFCNIELFFSSFAEILKRHKDVTNFLAIPGAFVPIMTFDFRKVNIDLLLAVLPDVKTVPRTLDILDDGLLGGMEDKSRRSINGPRDTLTIIKLIRAAGSRILNPPDADSRYDNFLRAVRVLRLWAKKRCLYSNKMGYLGGINFNIMLAMIIQFYPRKGPGTLLAKFFETLALWEKKPAESETDRHGGVVWRYPVRLCAELRGVSSILDEEVYPKTSFGVNWGLMPVVTPSYPAYNSTGNVNPWTLRVMNEELARAHALLKECERVAAEFASSFGGAGAGGSEVDPQGRREEEEEAAVAKLEALMTELVEPSDFFWRADHVHFLAVHVTCEGGGGRGDGAGDDEEEEEEGGGANPAAFASFKRLCEPMFRNLISASKYKNLGEYAGMKRIHLLPKVFEGMPLDQTAPPPPSSSSSAPPAPPPSSSSSSSSSAAAAAAPTESVFVVKAEEAAGARGAEESKEVEAGSTAAAEELGESEENDSLTMWVAFAQDSSKKERLELGNLVEAFQAQVRWRFESDPEGAGQSERMFIRPRLFKHDQLPPWVFELGDIGRERALELRAKQQKELKRKKKLAQQQQKQKLAVQRQQQEAMAAAAAAGAADQSSDSGGAAAARGDTAAATPGAAPAVASSAIAPTAGEADTAARAGPQGSGGAAKAGPGGGPAVLPDQERAEAAAAAAKPLWVATAEAHLALPSLVAPGDSAVLTPAGSFVQGCSVRGDKGAKRTRGGAASKRVAEAPGAPPSKRVCNVVFLPDEEEWSS